MRRRRRRRRVLLDITHANDGYVTYLSFLAPNEGSCASYVRRARAKGAAWAHDGKALVDARATTFVVESAGRWTVGVVRGR